MSELFPKTVLDDNEYMKPSLAEWWVCECGIHNTMNITRCSCGEYRYLLDAFEAMSLLLGE